MVRCQFTSRFIALFTTGLPLLACAISAHAQGTWETKAPMLQARGHFAGAVHSSRFYVFGGVSAANSAFDATPQIYDAVSDSWSFGAIEPVSRPASSAAETIGNKIYVVGGLINADGNTPTNAIRIYDPVANSWSFGAPMSIPRADMASGVIDGKLYVAGGGWPSVHSALEIYDPIANTWSAGAPLPLPVNGAGGAAINGKFYVTGGAYPGVYVNTVQIYDPATNSWTFGAPMPTARNEHTIAVLNGELYAVCGVNGFFLSTVEVYDPVSNTWRTETPAVRATYGHAMGVIDSKLYVTGGASGSAVDPYDATLEVFTPTPPDTDGDGLSDANEAVHGTNPNDPDTDDDGLLDGTEVDMAQGTGCPSPLDPDSDNDGLLDGAEVALGTSPCNPDTDGDGVNDSQDPTPLVPGVPGSYIENALRNQSGTVLNLSLSLFDAPNNNARAGRRNAMSNKLTSAANKVASGDRFGAIDDLTSLLQKLDGDPSPPDWMVDGTAKDALRDEILLLIALLSIP